MATTAKNAELALVRSHYVEFPRDRQPTTALPFEREEAFPVVAVEVPRAGRVRAEFHVDRYVYGSRETRRMGEWRIVLRDVREDDPENPHTSPQAKGIGDAARAAIREACKPLVAAWLDSNAYRTSRRKATSHAYRRELKDAAGRGAYALTQSRQYLAAISSELAPMEFDALSEATNLIGQGLDLLDRDPIG